MSESDESDEAFLKRMESCYTDSDEDVNRLVALARRGLTARNEALEEGLKDALVVIDAIKDKP